MPKVMIIDGMDQRDEQAVDQAENRAEGKRCEDRRRWLNRMRR